MSRARREYTVEVVFLNEPPTTCDPAQIHYWAARFAEMHSARMQAEAMRRKHRRARKALGPAKKPTAPQ